MCWFDFKLQNKEHEYPFPSLDRRWTVKGKRGRRLCELFASMRAMIHYAWIALEFLASGCSNMPEPEHSHCMLAGGLRNMVVMGWCL